MKANELRIGNLAKSNLAGICRINRSNLAGFDESSWEPISLTEEWLVKVGCKNRSALRCRVDDRRFVDRADSR